MKKGLLKVLGLTLTTAFLVAGCGDSAPAADASGAANTQTSAGSGAETTGTADADVERTVVVAVTHASPRPFTYYDDDNNLTGQNVELINAIFERLPQYELKWEVSPDFPAIFAGLDSDKYQIGVNNLSWNEERGEKYLFTAPMFKNELIVVSNSGLKFADTINNSHNQMLG